MSQLQQLKQTVNSLAESAKRTGQSLAAYDQQLKRYNDSVRGAIAGSTQRKDQEIMNAIGEAQKQVKSATAALQNAARIAQQYSASL
ncbi:MAG: hypothetical protein IPH27_11400 [Actinomycetales bacterium]|nr:hypothetical protein [Candidatus Phosphoribacter baldrii]MBK6956016.1 hypothetical protein [Candidatus Phosphoribacter baldrii]